MTTRPSGTLRRRRRRGGLRGLHRRPHPHLLGRHVAHPRLHGRAARAEPGTGHGLRRHARRRRGVGRHEPDHPLLTWASRRPSRKLLAEVVRERADHPALIVADETLTYAELDRRSARMAKALLAAAPARAPASALLAPDGALLLTTFYAALRIGALVTPISTLTTPPELAHIVRTSDAQMLVGARRFLRSDFAEPRGGASRPGRRRARDPLAHRAHRTCDRSGSTMPPDSRGLVRSTTCWRAPSGVGRRRAPRRRGGGRCRRPTTPSSSTPRAARRRRRRSCTASVRWSPSRRRWPRSSS